MVHARISRFHGDLLKFVPWELLGFDPPTPVLFAILAKLEFLGDGKCGWRSGRFGPMMVLVNLFREEAVMVLGFGSDSENLKVLNK